MPYVEVWVDTTEGLTRDQAQALQGLMEAVARAVKILPLEEALRLQTAARVVANECDFDEVKLPTHPVDEKYRKWLAERSVTSGSAD